MRSIELEPIQAFMQTMSTHIDPLLCLSGMSVEDVDAAYRANWLDGMAPFPLHFHFHFPFPFPAPYLDVSPLPHSYPACSTCGLYITAPSKKQCPTFYGEYQGTYGRV